MRATNLILAGLLAATAMPAVSSAASGGRGARIMSYANRWLGTPYRWGGTTRSGIDCSAYLRQMYRDLFNIEIPRTTNQQKNMGIPLSIDPTNPSKNLQPGDLIFYFKRSTNYTTHVVMYAGNDTITHSQGGRGVVIDPLSKVFGRKIAARRLLVPKNGGSDDSDGFEPIQAAGPIRPVEVPCPPSIRAKRHEIRTYARKSIVDWKIFGDRAICDFRALAEGLRKKGGAIAVGNAAKLDDHAIWLENIDALKGEIGRGW